MNIVLDALKLFTVPVVVSDDDSNALVVSVAPYDYACVGNTVSDNGDLVVVTLMHELASVTIEAPGTEFGGPMIVL